MANLAFIGENAVITRPTHVGVISFAKPFTKEEDLSLGDFSVYFVMLTYLDTLLADTPWVQLARSFQADDSPPKDSSEGCGLLSNQSCILKRLELAVNKALLPQAVMEGWSHYFGMEGFSDAFKPHEEPDDEEGAPPETGKSDSSKENKRRKRSTNPEKMQGIRPMACLRRFICEMQHFEVNRNELVAGVVEILFEMDEEDVQEDGALEPYFTAQRQGAEAFERDGSYEECGELYYCPHSFFDWLQV